MMGVKTVGIGCFFAGAVVGVVGTYLYLQKWVNDKIHEEIQAYREKNSEEKKSAEKESRSRKVEERAEDFDADGEDVGGDRIRKDAEDLMQRYSNRYERGGNDGSIRVIPPLEFDNFEDNPKYENYRRVYLTYYFDKVLVENETKNLVLDLRGTVGVHFEDHFEDYGDDIEDEDLQGTACYIRNDRLKIFYEITKDFRTYKEAIGKDIPK